MNRFFIDECLSVALVAVAKEQGISVDYGPHIGMAGWQDWNIARFAFENSYIVVTNNRKDFLREYMKHEMHHGLVVLVPNLERKRQVDLFSRTLDRLAETDDPPDNKLIEALGEARYTFANGPVKITTSPICPVHLGLLDSRRPMSTRAACSSTSPKFSGSSRSRSIWRFSCCWRG